MNDSNNEDPIEIHNDLNELKEIEDNIIKEKISFDPNIRKRVLHFRKGPSDIEKKYAKLAFNESISRVNEIGRMENNIKIKKYNEEIEITNLNTLKENKIFEIKNKNGKYNFNTYVYNIIMKSNFYSNESNNSIELLRNISKIILKNDYLFNNKLENILIKNINWKELIKGIIIML